MWRCLPPQVPSRNIDNQGAAPAIKHYVSIAAMHPLLQAAAHLHPGAWMYDVMASLLVSRWDAASALRTSLDCRGDGGGSCKAAGRLKAPSQATSGFAEPPAP